MPNIYFTCLLTVFELVMGVTVLLKIVTTSNSKVVTNSRILQFTTTQSVFIGCPTTASKAVDS
jgi:hypothetical protein